MAPIIIQECGQVHRQILPTLVAMLLRAVEQLNWPSSPERKREYGQPEFRILEQGHPESPPRPANLTASNETSGRDDTPQQAEHADDDAAIADGA
jgi:hypothetical protein